jgi:hypothetical protein
LNPENLNPSRPGNSQLALPLPRCMTTKEGGSERRALMPVRFAAEHGTRSTTTMLVSGSGSGGPLSRHLLPCTAYCL